MDSTFRQGRVAPWIDIAAGLMNGRSIVAAVCTLLTVFAAASTARAQTTAPAYVVSSQAPLNATASGFGGARGNYAVNSRGDFFINDANGHDLEYPASGGGPIIVFDGNSYSTGGAGVAVDPFDNLYVAFYDYNNNGGPSATNSFFYEFPSTNQTYPGAYTYKPNTPPGACNPFEPADPPNTPVAVPANTGVCSVGNFVSADGNYLQAWGIAADGQGNTYEYTGYDNTYGGNSGGIFQCDLLCNQSAAGASATAYTVKLSTGVISFIADYAGDVYYVDYKNVWVIPAGSPATANTPTLFDGSYNNPYGVTLDKSGNMYVTDWTGIWEVPAVEAGGAPCQGGTDVCTLQPTKKYKILLLNNQPNGVYDGAVGPAVDDYGNIVFAPYYGAVSEASLWAGKFGSAQIGATGSSSVNFTVLFDQATTIGAFQAVQGGAAATEFTVSPGTCTVGTSFAANSTCTFSGTFTPSGLGIRTGAVLITDSNGNTTTTRLSGVGTGTGITVDPGTPNAIGTGFKAPSGVAVDNAGNVYITDSAANTVTQYPAGGGTPVSIGTALSVPTGVAVDGAGDVYIVNQGTGNSATTPTGTIVEVPSVNGVPQNAAQVTLFTGLNTPTAIVSDGTGNLFVSATGSNAVFELRSADRAAEDGALIPRGYGLSAPTGLALDTSGNIYVADTGNNRVLELGSGFQNVVGSSLTAPTGVAVDPSGSVMIADGTGRIIRVPNETYTVPNSTTPAEGLNTVDQEVLGSPLSYPYNLAVDNSGNLYVTDTVESLVYQLQRTTGAVNFGDWNLNTVSDVQPIVVSNIGNKDVTLGTPIYTPVPAATEFTVTGGSAPLGCASGLFHSGYNCTLNATFAPTVAGVANYPLVLNAPSETNAAPTMNLTGTGINGDSATLVLTQTAPVGAISYGQQIIISAQVAPAGNTPTPQGTVVFTFDGQPQRPVTLDKTTGIATITFNLLNAGVHTISAFYEGDSDYGSQTSSPLTLNIGLAASTDVLTITGDSAIPLSVAPGDAVNMTATLVPATNGLFTGSVTFIDLNGNPLTTTTAGYTVKLGPANITTGLYTVGYSFTPPPLPPGTALRTYNIVAQFSGNENYLPENSAGVTFIESPPTYTITANSSTSITSTSSNPGTINLTVTDYSNYQGGVSLTCTGLPANAYCVFLPISAQLTPAPLTLVNTIYPVPVTLQIVVDENPTYVEGAFAWTGALVLCLLIFQRRRLGWQSVKLTCIVALLSLVTIASLSGCGSGGSAFPTPPGTYPFVITGTSTPLTGGSEPGCDFPPCVSNGGPTSSSNSSSNVIVTLNGSVTVK